MDKKEYKIEVGKRLKTIISEKFNKQCAFAATTGISEVQISKYVNGEELPDLINLTKIVKATNISADYFLFGKNKEEVVFDDNLKANNQGINIIKAINFLIEKGYICRDILVYDNFILHLTDKQRQCIKTLIYINEMNKKGYNEKNIKGMINETYKKYAEKFKSIELYNSLGND